MRYAKSGWMFLDFVATFPFDLFADVLYTRLIRLARLSKLINLLDISRFHRIIKSYFEKSNRADRIQTQYIVMYIYKMFRLVIIVFMITYLIGCIWWLSVSYINPEDSKSTYITYFEMDKLFIKSGKGGLCGIDMCEDVNSLPSQFEYIN